MPFGLLWRQRRDLTGFLDPGMKILCREPVSQWVGSYGHPLGMLYDEQDAMVDCSSISPHVGLWYAYDRPLCMLAALHFGRLWRHYT